MGATYDHASLQPEAQQPSSCCVCFVLSIMAILILAVITAISFLLAQAFNQEPHYSVAIGHVSGLDPTADLTGHGRALEPEFNLTLRVASWGIWATECAEPRMYATVSYRGVPLAASPSLTQQICAGPMEAVDFPLVARGDGVVVPGSLLDSLAMDMRSGVPEFDVELHGPSPRNWAWQCGPRRVGDEATLQMECELLLQRHDVHD